MAVLRGIVKDRQDNSPVPWLAVNLDGAHGVTDKNGAFIFRDVAVGEHRLALRSMFYRPITQQVKVEQAMVSLEVVVDKSTL